MLAQNQFLESILYGRPKGLVQKAKAGVCKVWVKSESQFKKKHKLKCVKCL